MKSLKVSSILLFILILDSAFVFGEETETLLVTLSPSGVIPVGESASYFSFGGGGGLSVDFGIPDLPFLFIRMGADYTYLPIVTKDAISVFAVSMGGGISYRPMRRMILSAYGAGGYYYGYMTDGSGAGSGNLSLSGGVSAGYDISPFVNIGVSVDYQYRYLLYNGLGISIGTSIHPGKTGLSKGDGPSTPSLELLEALSPGVSGSGLDAESISFNQIFPVLFKHYDSSPVGRIILFNNESLPVTNVTVSFFVDRYMDNPKQSPVIKKIEPKSALNIDIFALFSDSVLDITEGTKVSANVMVKYTINGKQYGRKYVVSMDMYDRNAIIWDDDRKAAAFVTAKDPVVLEFAKNISGWVKHAGPSAIDKNLCIAMGLHTGLRQYGLTYQIDPKTPFTEFSKDKLSVDFLQFPRQTLQYSSGDCDDLSILYSALLESVGIETAFITIPGHIYMAFSPSATPDDARRIFLKQNDLIFLNDRVWIPVEITMIQSGFLEAWAEGAKEWRENSEKNQVHLYPMHDSWKEYRPVGLPGSAIVKAPDKVELVEAFKAELNRFIDRELFPRVVEFEDKIKQSGKAPRYINRLGVLYARYGLNCKAADQFGRILEKEEYVPALLNMGNISFMNKDLDGALGYYRRAYAKEPENPKVLLSLARVSHELEDYREVEKAYGRLKALDPGLAKRFAYLELTGEEASRAADAGNEMEVVVWDEE